MLISNAIMEKIKKKILYAILFLSIHTICESSLIVDLQNYESCERLLRAHNYVIIYAYQNNSSDEYKKIDIITKNNLEQLLLSHKQLIDEPIKILSINYSKDEFSDFKKEYKLKNTPVLLFFYKSNFLKELKLNEPISESILENCVMDIFNDTSIMKIRKNHTKKETYKKTKKHTQHPKKIVEHYSFPRVSASFGWGAPFYDWPGYWNGYPYAGYGRGCYGGGYGYGRPAIGFGLSFNHFSGGGCGRR